LLPVAVSGQDGRFLAVGTNDRIMRVLREDKLGSIERGKVADLVVIERNPLDPKAGPNDQLDKLQVLKTIVGGEMIYDREKAAP
jgi:predicted amidohydrolase YtcJ